jgi:arginine-tRNA-protein transferase
MLDDDLIYINEAFHAANVSHAQFDRLLAEGWRHFGTQFFRYNWAFHDLDIRSVVPLRIRLANFSHSKSQRRVLRKNEDLRAELRPANISKEAEMLFHRHKGRFKRGVPDSIYDFIARDADSAPCETLEMAVYKDEQLLALSYFDIGENSTSGIYAIFEPRESQRSLGIFTMLKEIEFSIESDKEFYYQGYAYEGESFYDYKKRFRGTEAYEWSGNWKPCDLR